MHDEPGHPGCAWTTIPLREQAWGRLHVLLVGAQLDEIDRLALDRAAIAIALLLLSQRDAAQVVDQVGDDLIADILRGNVFSESDLFVRARALGCDLRTRRLVADCGLIPVLVGKEVPGFVHNRLLYAVLREAVSLVEKGVVSPEELDKCFKWGLGLKLAVIGPMELLDVAGLDVYAAVAGYLNADLDNIARVPDYIAEKVQAKRFGMKTGEGIYRYTPQKLGALRAERAAKLLAVRKTLEGH